MHAVGIYLLYSVICHPLLCRVLLQRGSGLGALGFQPSSQPLAMAHWSKREALLLSTTKMAVFLSPVRRERWEYYHPYCGYSLLWLSPSWSHCKLSFVWDDCRNLSRPSFIQSMVQTHCLKVCLVGWELCSDMDAEHKSGLVVVVCCSSYQRWKHLHTVDDA